MKKRSYMKKGILIVIGIVLALIFVAPVLLLINSSFKSLQEIYIDILALPQKFTLNNYIQAFEQMDFLPSLVNSLLITVLSRF